MAAKRARWNLYPRSTTGQLDMRLFRNPTAEYRGAPFWSWNSNLDRATLLRQIDLLRDMGFGGFHIHARTGLATEYLGDEFMALVRDCAQAARKKKMLAWLYDEDRWPSGFAGGIVTRDRSFRIRNLLWTTKPYQPSDAPEQVLDRDTGGRAENGRTLASYEIELTSGRLKRYKRISSNRRARGGTIWHAYLELGRPSSWFNNQTYIDTMNRAAVERFIETTHQRYARAVGQFFGSVVPSIFTDEPHFTKKQIFRRGDDTNDVILPFSENFLETYQQSFGENLLDSLPELFWNRADDAPSLTRYRYHEHTAERFASSFGDTIAAWCDRHGIALTGHMLSEATLFGQTRAVGEVMRGLRSFQLPGIDMLEDKLELTTAKQAQSVARQNGRPGVTSELYGVTNWDFDFAGHKRQGDWQAAMGVTVRVPHLAWVSMAGEAKRDYPAAIDYHSPWFREYPLIENHFARVNTVLTRGRPLVRVAVIHPIESFWLAFGPVEHNGATWEELEHSFQDITKWLSFGLIDFDFVSEASLHAPATRHRDSAKFHVGQMSYDAIVVPNVTTIRSTTLRRLKQMAQRGGTVVFAGEIPRLVDAQPSAAVASLAANSTVIPFSSNRILQALEPFREIDVRKSDGGRAESIVHQIRIDGAQRHAFLCNTDRERGIGEVTIRLHGRWRVELLDTMAGTRREIGATVDDGWTIVPFEFAAHHHALLTLSPGRSKPIAVSRKKWIETARLQDPVAITLNEPNALLLDQADWRLDDGAWQPPEEILRIDNHVRRKLGLRTRGGQICQPWTDAAPAPVLANLQLRFAIESEVAIRGAMLALENAAATRVSLDGRPVTGKIAGWWVDESIQTVKLPPLRAGTHDLVLSIPFTRKSDLEWCYFLGDFGVAVAGRHARITAPIRELAWGDWTFQGLPFYAGNVTYHCEIKSNGETMIEAPKFKNPLLSVKLDGKPAGKIAFAPYQLFLDQLRGKHRLEITAFGNRVNAFGPLHHMNEKLTWVGPAAWRSEGASWSYEYNFKRLGVLTAPLIKSHTG